MEATLTLSVLADRAALSAMADAVYFDDPAAPLRDVSSVFPLRWLACAEVKQQIQAYCPPNCIPVQTRMRSRRVREIEAGTGYVLSVAFVAHTAPPRLSLEYDVREQTGSLMSSGAVEMTFVILEQVFTL